MTRSLVLKVQLFGLKLAGLCFQAEDGLLQGTVGLLLAILEYGKKIKKQTGFCSVSNGIGGLLLACLK
jgi:hypothetical protein